jgi:hypothetical protein
MKKFAVMALSRRCDPIEQMPISSAISWASSHPSTWVQTSERSKARIQPCTSSPKKSPDEQKTFGLLREVEVFALVVHGVIIDTLGAIDAAKPTVPAAIHVVGDE